MARSDSSKSSGSDSSKMVAKAAKAGATPSSSAGRDRASLGFPMALLGVVVLGSALVFYAWGARDVEAFSPTFGDHWHLPYGIYDCQTGEFLPDLVDPELPNAGIHTHGDGVIHVHPQSSTATGNNAVLERFFEATRAGFDDDDALTFTDREALTEEGATCDGEPAILQVARFLPGSDTPEEVLTEDLGSLRLRADQEGVVIALLPDGADIPPPPESSVATAAAASPSIVTTDGLSDLNDMLSEADLGDADPGGFDENGVLLDSDGNPILNADGEEININDFQTGTEETEPTGDGEAESDADTESPEDDTSGTESPEDASDTGDEAADG